MKRVGVKGKKKDIATKANRIVYRKKYIYKYISVLKEQKGRLGISFWKQKDFCEKGTRECVQKVKYVRK